MLYSFIVFVFVMIMAAVLLFAMSVAVAPRNPHPVKDDTYECGLPAPEPIVSSINFQYYFFAIVFIAMDIAGMVYVLYSIGNASASYGWIFLIFTLVLMVPLTYVMAGGRNGT